MNQLPARGSGGGPGSPPGDRQNLLTPRKIPWFWILLIVVLVINYALGQMLLPQPNHVQVPYSIFEQQVAEGNVMQITSQGDAIQGEFKKAVTWPASGANATSGIYFDTRVAAFSDPALLPLLKSKN